MVTRNFIHSLLTHVISTHQITSRMLLYMLFQIRCSLIIVSRPHIVRENRIFVQTTIKNEYRWSCIS
jgi:hypothetical protein